jgi:hypothetical protein
LRWARASPSAAAVGCGSKGSTRRCPLSRSCGGRVDRDDRFSGSDLAEGQFRRSRLFEGGSHIDGRPELRHHHHDLHAPNPLLSGRLRHATLWPHCRCQSFISRPYCESWPALFHSPGSRSPRLRLAPAIVNSALPIADEPRPAERLDRHSLRGMKRATVGTALCVPPLPGRSGSPSLPAPEPGLNSP